LSVDVATIEVFRLERLIRLQAVNGLPQVVKLSQRGPHRGLRVRLQQGADGLDHDTHRLQRRREAVMIEPFHIGPGPPAVLGRCGMFPPKTDWIDTPWPQGEEGFEANIAFPIRHEVVHVPEPFTTMETQVTQQNTARLCPTAAILSAMDMKAV
jgi:hypothetical protein